MKLFCELTQADVGKRVRVDDREGTLAWARNPSYPKKMNVQHWYLYVPNERFGEVAVSLQWMFATAEVEELTSDNHQA